MVWCCEKGWLLLLLGAYASKLWELRHGFGIIARRCWYRCVSCASHTALAMTWWWPLGVFIAHIECVEHATEIWKPFFGSLGCIVACCECPPILLFWGILMMFWAVAAVLSAIQVRPDWLEDFWCKLRVFVSNSRHLAFVQSALSTWSSRASTQLSSSIWALHAWSLECFLATWFGDLIWFVVSRDWEVQLVLHKDDNALKEVHRTI